MTGTEIETVEAGEFEGRLTFPGRTATLAGRRDFAVSGTFTHVRSWTTTGREVDRMFSRGTLEMVEYQVGSLPGVYAGAIMRLEVAGRPDLSFREVAVLGEGPWVKMLSMGLPDSLRPNEATARPPR